MWMDTDLLGIWDGADDAPVLTSPQLMPQVTMVFNPACMPTVPQFQGVFGSDPGRLAWRRTPGTSIQPQAPGVDAWPRHGSQGENQTRPQSQMQRVPPFMNNMLPNQMPRISPRANNATDVTNQLQSNHIA